MFKEINRDMQEQIIAFKTAKLAKEKGFDIQVVDFYNTDKKPRVTSSCDYMSERDAISNWNNEQGSYPTLPKDVSCSAPTQSLLQKWLREVCKIIVQVECNYWDEVRGWNTYSVTVFNPISEDVLNDSKIFSFYKSYEEALEIGLQEALKLIEIVKNDKL